MIYYELKRFILEIDWEFLDIVLVIKIKMIYDNGNCGGIPRKFYQEEMVKYFVYTIQQISNTKNFRGSKWDLFSFNFH